MLANWQIALKFNLRGEISNDTQKKKKAYEVSTVTRQTYIQLILVDLKCVLNQQPSTHANVLVNYHN